MKAITSNQANCFPDWIWSFILYIEITKALFMSCQYRLLQTIKFLSLCGTVAVRKKKG